MRTIVLQSFRTHDVPGWISACMDSVESWSRHNGWAYERADDAFFRHAPPWAHRHCGANLYALTDICRLSWLREKLQGGYERAIWADADLLVFDPDRLRIAPDLDCGFAHELFVRLEPDGHLNPTEAVNNALMVFGRGQALLDRYLAACLERLEAFPSGAVPRTALGPELIAEIGREQALPLIHGVGLFTLAVMRDVACGGGPVARECVRCSPQPLGAANLCHFLRNDTPAAERPRFDALYERAVRRLLETRGEILRSLPPQAG